MQDKALDDTNTASPGGREIILLRGFHMSLKSKSKSLQISNWTLACCSITNWCLTLCSPMDCSMPCFLVLHYLPELAQTHVQQVNDAIPLSYPLSAPSPPALNLSQHQSTFQWVTPGDWSIGTSASASVFPINIQDWFLLGWTGLILQSKELSRVFSNTTVQKHQFFSAQISLWSHPYIHTWLLEKP